MVVNLLKIRNIVRAIIGLVVMTMSFSSCRKYLDEKSSSAFVVPKSLDDVQGLLDDAGFMNSIVTPSFGEASSDDYYVLPQTIDYLLPRLQDVYIWKPADYFFENDWSKAYKPVYNANLSLELLNQIPVTQDNIKKWENAKGSALFYRAYFFLNLMWVHAKVYDSSSASTDLGIVLRSTSDFNAPSTRASVKQSYDFIIADTKEAIRYLDKDPLNVLRPSKVAGYGLLARTYLSIRSYDSALKYSDLCLGLNGQIIDYNGDGDINGSILVNLPFKRFNKETIFYTEMNNLLNALIGPSSAKANDVLYASYETDDLRKVAFFRPVGAFKSFKGNYTSNGTYFTGIATNEMYLTRAECRARTHDKVGAMNDLNTLLIKRWKNGLFLPKVASDDAQALDIILVERRKELLMRGLRWIDIKRLNKEGRNIVLSRSFKNEVYQLGANSNYYALPLPKDIIELANIPQNP